MADFDSVGFIGGGRVTRCLLEGWQRGGAIPKNVKVSDPSGEVVERLEAGFGVSRAAENAEAARSDLVVLAVHPPVAGDVLAEIAGSVSAAALVLSLVPKVPAAKIAADLGTARVVRMIPNAPAAIGKGYNPVAYGEGVDEATREDLQRLFAPWGACPEVPEDTLEAYAMVSGMGPTYLWFQFQTLRELAVSFGLAPAAADEAVRAMVHGAVDCLLDGGASDEVIDMIPIRPLKEDEETITDAYRMRLTALYEKLAIR